MATTTLNTRIALKYDTLTNWNASEFILKKGEVAICSLANSETAEQSTPPAVLLKVGDGDHKFRELPWASGLAADVYGWAKAPTKPSYTASEVGADKAGSAATAETNAKAYTDQKFGEIPAQAEYTLETGAADGSLVLKKDGVAVGDAAVVQGWATLLAKAQKGVDDAAAAAAAAQAAQSTAEGRYLKPEGGIPKTDLAQAVQTSLGKADTALQNHQTVTLESGTNNGTVKITVNGTATDNVAVKGLKSAAYTESSAYATAAQGTKADNAMPKAGGAFTGAVTVQAPTAEMNPATKQYVDTAINTVKQFEYQVVTELPTAAQATMGKIYLVAHSHNPSDGQPDSYDEFITVQSGSTYKWERIGNTDIDLSGYVPTTRKINNKALSSDINLGASDVGVTEAAFPGLNKTGTITGITMNGASKGTSGVVDLGTVITAHQDISGKQDKLTAEQLNAVNSGITEAKVGTYDGYATTIAGKQDKLSTAQLGAVNSGITAAKVGTYDGYADKITALEGKPGLDKVGTVTSVSAGVGLKITGTAGVTPKVEIDEATVFVFDCGSATVNIG
jgi:hypothetical protein